MRPLYRGYALDATEFGAGNSNADQDTAAIQKALNLVGGWVDGDSTQNVGGRKGGVVWLPPGGYAVNRPILIPKHVSLEGASKGHGAEGKPFFATSINIEASGQEREDSAFQLDYAARLANLSIAYSDLLQPLPASDNMAWHPTPYAPTVRAVGGCICVENVFFLNPYIAIEVGDHGVEGLSSQHVISYVWGTPLRCGIRVINCMDVGRINNIHFWTFWGNRNRSVENYKLNYGNAVELGTTDWQIINDLFCYGYFSGIKFDGWCNGNFSNIQVDFGRYGLDFYESSAIGINISNLFVAIASSGGSAIRSSGSRSSTLTVTNACFWGSIGTPVDWNSPGDLHLCNVRFNEWDRSRPAIRLDSPVTKLRAMISGCYFPDADGARPTKLAIEIGHGAVDRVCAYGNQLTDNGFYVPPGRPSGLNSFTGNHGAGGKANEPIYFGKSSFIAKGMQFIVGILRKVFGFNN